MEGTWCYGGKSYHLRAEKEGGLRFEEGEVCGLLHPLGGWYQGSLLKDQAERGTIRLRLDEARAKIVSNFMAAGRTNWGEEIVACRQDSVWVGEDDWQSSCNNLKNPRGF